ncbi:Brain/reproductive organ-expressed protein [Cynara cardunculus var. scolymus]|uniref:BRISC and BRCA1-A complex member 2 n=1 Tax=Cynara cardunculus var. scolymus TaxID=59895 RepID=A0A118JVA6_CYNCS|nr:Brain/reproductive organ-expressed protein [Cynara cardunculus var. scolymus]
MQATAGLRQLGVDASERILQALSPVQQHPFGDVIYNAQFPLLAPDIVFGPEDDNFRPYHACGGDLKPKNNLSDWNCKDPTRLLSLILELRSLYMAYQKKRVGEVDD